MKLILENFLSPHVTNGNRVALFGKVLVRDNYVQQQQQQQQQRTM